MRKRLWMASAAAFALLCVGQWPSRAEESANPEPGRGMERTLLICYEGNRWGQFEYYKYCESKPFGGFDRTANALKQFRKEGPLLYVNAGNLFSHPDLPCVRDKYRLRGEALVEMSNQVGLDAFAPGPQDFQLGLGWLKLIRKRQTFLFFPRTLWMPRERLRSHPLPS